jgi:hypothetical protein
MRRRRRRRRRKMRRRRQRRRRGRRRRIRSKAAIQLFLDRVLQKQVSQQKMQSPVSILHHTVSGLFYFSIAMT